MSDLEKAASRVNKVASSTQDEQQLADVNLESLRFLGQSLLTGDVYDQMSNLPNLEEAVKKRWRTEIPGVMWKDQSDQDEEKINMSDVDHLTLTETSHTTSVLPCLEGGTGSDGVLCQGGGALSLTGDVCKKPDQQPLESGEINRFSVGDKVYGICMYNNNVFLVNWSAVLYVYSSSGELIQKHIVNGMKGSVNVRVMTHSTGDKLVISSKTTLCLYYIPVQSIGDTCTLGTTHSKQLNYKPYGLCVNNQNNLVIADLSNVSLHVYNSSGDEITTIKLPSGVTPRYLSPDPSDGYIITGNKQVVWIDGQGAQQRRHEGTACGITLSAPRGVVRDSKNRYLVADRDNNQLLLFSKGGGEVIKDKITKPYSLYLDQEQGKLYVGTWDSGQVVVYDYEKLLAENKPVKYSKVPGENDGIIYTTIRLGIKSN